MKPTPPPPRPLTPLRPAGHGRDRILLIASVLAPLALGGLVELLLPHEPTLVLGVGAGTALLALLVSWRSRHLRDLLGSFKFAAAILAVVAIVVMIGTLVPQDKPAAFYAAYYPRAGSALTAIGVTHVFHGAWFSALLGSVAAGLVVSAVRRWPPTRRNVGFFLTHSGLLVIMGGAALSVLFAVRGSLGLRVGSPPLTSVVATRNGEEVDLGFAVRLDGFTMDTYAAEHRLTVYDVPPDGQPKPLASLDEDIGVVHRLPDGASYRVRKQETGGTGMHAIVENGREPRPIAIGEELRLADGRTLRAVAFYPHFSFDLATRSARSIDDEPVNPALEVTVEGQRRFLFAGAAGQQHGAGDGLAYLFGGGGPSLIVEVTDASGTRSGRLDASAGAAIFFGDHKALTYERRPEEARSYRSAITLIDGADKESTTVSVNAPAQMNGWSLYQSTFDPRDLSRSGLEAVRDPGVTWVFVGFTLLSIGVPMMVNLEPWLRRRRQKGARS